MQLQHIDSSSQQPIVQSDFQNANAIIQSISTPKDSQPTKLKVKNFKNRVFHLLKIYTNQSSDINPLITCLKQQMFFNQPQKMQELLHTILNKQNVTIQNLQQLLQYYKVILLYKSDNKTNTNVAPQFLKLLKKISSIDVQLVHTTLLTMLKAFAYQRKCKLNVNFFMYFFRKYQSLKDIKKLFIEKCLEFIQDQKLRNAQKKQINKILSNIDKSFRVKNNKVKKQQENVQEIQQQSDDIKTTNKKNINITKVKKHQEESKKIQEQSQAIEGQQKNKKKLISVQQQQKLQRIKANKKNNRKQNKNTQTKQKNHQKPKQQTQTKPESKPQHQNKFKPNNQSKPQHYSKSKPQNDNKPKQNHDNKPKQNHDNKPTIHTQSKSQQKAQLKQNSQPNGQQRSQSTSHNNHSNHSERRNDNKHDSRSQSNDNRRGDNSQSRPKFNNDKKHFNGKKQFGDRKPFNGNKSFDSKKKFDNKKSFNNNKHHKNTSE